MARLFRLGKRIALLRAAKKMESKAASLESREGNASAVEYFRLSALEIRNEARNLR